MFMPNNRRNRLASIGSTSTSAAGSSTSVPTATPTSTDVATLYSNAGYGSTAGTVESLTPAQVANLTPAQTAALDTMTPAQITQLAATTPTTLPSTSGIASFFQNLFGGSSTGTASTASGGVSSIITTNFVPLLLGAALLYLLLRDKKR